MALAMLLDLARDHAWQEDAACLDAPQEDFDALFFPTADHERQAAKARLKYCGGCPVFDECEQYMLQHNPMIYDGTWAGRDARTVQRQARRTSSRPPVAA